MSAWNSKRGVKIAGAIALFVVTAAVWISLLKFANPII